MIWFLIWLVTRTPIVTGSKLNMSLIFIMQWYYADFNIRLNCEHYFIMKITIVLELQEIVTHTFSDIDFKVLMKLNKKCAAH